MGFSRRREGRGDFSMEGGRNDCLRSPRPLKGGRGAGGEGALIEAHWLLDPCRDSPRRARDFLARGKKVPKETHPAFPARRSRASLTPQGPVGRLRKLACGSNSEAALPRPSLAPLGGAEGEVSICQCGVVRGWILLSGNLSGAYDGYANSISPWPV